jgi:CspA family cold shock protein
MDGYTTLKAGQPVQFEIIQGPKGLHAVKISGQASTANPVKEAAHSHEKQHEHS